MERFFEAADVKLQGEFVLLGGSVLQVLGISDRVTLDIDLAHRERSQAGRFQLELMEIAEQLDLPIEAINQAGAFFLYRIPGWNKCLVNLFEGKNCTFFRPNINLYLRLKAARMSETDLDDCRQMLTYAKKQEESLAKKPLVDHLEHLRQRTENLHHRSRLDKLIESIDAW